MRIDDSRPGRSARSLPRTDRALGHQDGAFDRVIELADVARPAVIEQGLHRALIEAGELLAVVPRVMLQEVRGERRNILAALAQRGHADLDGIEAEQQILAEAARRHFFVRIGVGRRQQAHVDAPRVRRSDPLEFAGLQHAQQLVLLAQRDVGDLVEEQRAAVGQLEAADAIDLGVGERAFDVAEQLALEHAFGDAAGVDRHHRLRGASARRRGCARATRPLPVPFSPVISTFASDGPTREIICSTGCMAADCAISVGWPSPPPRSSEFSASRRWPWRSAWLNSACVRRIGEQARVLPRLLHEIARAAAHGFDGEVDAAPGGHDDDGQRGVERAQVVEEIEPFLAGRRVARVVEVHQDDVELAAFDGGDDAGGRGGGLNLIALGLEQQAERFEHVGLIVRHEDPRHAARGAVGGAIGSAGRGERVYSVHGGRS